MGSLPQLPCTPLSSPLRTVIPVLTGSPGRREYRGAHLRLPGSPPSGRAAGVLLCSLPPGSWWGSLAISRVIFLSRVTKGQAAPPSRAGGPSAPRSAVCRAIPASARPVREQRGRDRPPSPGSTAGGAQGYHDVQGAVCPQVWREGPRARGRGLSPCASSWRGKRRLMGSQWESWPLSESPALHLTPLPPTRVSSTRAKLIHCLHFLPFVILKLIFVFHK